MQACFRKRKPATQEILRVANSPTISARKNGKANPPTDHSPAGAKSTTPGPPADRRQCFHPGSEIWYPHIMEYQDLLSGFVRMHILHHAAESDIYGQWMIDELAHHGYKMSAGTLYPMLHGMEQKGYLKSYEKRSG